MMKIIMITDEEADMPTHPAPAEVNDEVLVTGTLCAHNDVGGTEILKHAGVMVRVTRSFWDYETGWRFVGKIDDESIVALVRQQATTGIDVEDYRTKYPTAVELIASAEKARAEFDPSVVYFSEGDFTIDVGPALR